MRRTSGRRPYPLPRAGWRCAPALLWLALVLLVLDIALRKTPMGGSAARACPAAAVRVRSSPGAPQPSTKPASDRHRAKSDERQRQKDAQDTADALLAAKAARKQK